jgi:two-component system, OmpR family, phosphate regulon sensor histidine kinase PhoR
MTWLIRRLSAVIAALLAGGLLGWLLGLVLRAPLLVGALGTAAGVVTLGLVDGIRGRRLMRWLRGSQAGDAPRDTGFWGELGYRVERAVRLREKTVESERKRLEQFLSAIEASPNGVMMLDGTSRIDWCSAVSAEHFGLDPQSDRLQRVTNLVRSPAFVAYLQEERYAEAVVFPAPDGQRSLSVVVRPYGEGMKLVLSQDVTERERADAMRRDFVANVSHEIRTPLTVLAGFVETMAQLPLTEVERRRVLDLMGQQTQRMQDLVGDLLTLAQLEGSPRPAADRWLDLSALLRRALGDAAALSAGRHAVVASGEENFEVAASETELLSAVANLLNNAVRYTPEGGRIELAWRGRDDGGLDLTVTDTGPGIAREHLPRLTERFYRVDGSRSRDTGGTGLGLSIVKHVIQRHGGEIDIQSEPGRGACFKLVFPPLRVRRKVAASHETVAALAH